MSDIARSSPPDHQLSVRSNSAYGLTWRYGRRFAVAAFIVGATIFLGARALDVSLFATPIGFATSGDAPVIALREIAGFDHPVHVTGAGDGSGRLFVLELTGKIWIVQAGKVLPTPFMDLTSKLDCGDGRKRPLSIAFPRNHVATRRFYVKYLDRACNITIARYTTTADPNIGDIASEQILLSKYVGDGLFGGPLYFGPDGYLYASIGDGSHSDTDPGDNGKDLGTIFGKMLRIDVESGSPTYTIPPTNPFVATPGARPEIWSSGFRNPWRFSFDRSTGDLYIGDIGSQNYEEVDFQPASSTGGQDYGWKRLEGNHCFAAATCSAVGLTPPVVEYDHSIGCSVTGGAVYRGPTFPAIDGLYVFGDFCSGDIWGLRRVGSAWETSLLTTTAHGTGPGYAAALSVVGFGEDDDGKLYVLDYGHQHLDGSVDGGGLYLIETPGSVPSDIAATPVITPAGGTFTGSVTVSLASSTPGATVRYTTDGTFPTISSPAYGAPFPVSVTTTVRARAFAQNFIDSAASSATFNILVPTAATPTMNPAGGTFASPVTVSLASSTTGATIRYTTNGSTPTSSSPLYSAPFVVSASATITARAFAAGYQDSAVATATFTIGNATFVRIDGATQGSWHGVYGTDGALVVGDATALPAYAQITPAGYAWTWTTATTDVRALQRVTGTGRLASVRYADAFTIDVNLTDGQAHQVAFYGLDWDSGGRVQRMDVRDAVTGVLLDSRQITAFTAGQYVVWQLSGHLTVQFTRIAGSNAVVAGVFLDSAGPGPAATPTINPAGGTFTSPATVSLTSSTPGAAIRYTIDGSTPTSTSPAYTGPFMVSTTTTVLARALAAGFQDSAVATATFTIAAGTTATPTISPGGGNFTSPVTVSLASATAGATIRYTLNGSAPTSTSPVYGGPFAVSVSTPICARAFAPGLLDSDVATATFTITSAASSPSATFVRIDGSTQGSWHGVYGAEGALVVGDATALPAYAQITPTAYAWTWTTATTDVRALQRVIGSGRLASVFYGETFSVDVNLTDGQRHQVAFYGLDWDTAGRAQRMDVRDAVTGVLLDSRLITAFTAGQYVVWQLSGHVTVQFTRTAGSNAVVAGVFFDSAGPGTAATPTISPAGGTFASSMTVSLTSLTPGATIRYTTDGSTPTSTSPAYTGPFMVSTTTTVLARAFAAGFQDSAVATATFTIAAGTTATPTFSPAGGTFTGPVTVSLASPTPGAAIRYTTDGSTPSSTSLLYAGSFVISATTAVRARAFAAGLLDSDIATATFTIAGAASGTSATFVRIDGATQGSWHGVYGADGALVVGDAMALPAYAQIAPTGYAYTWTTSTSDVRALQRVSGSGRLASVFYGETFSVDVNLTDGQRHQVAFYGLDWDTAGRAQRMDVRDAVTGALLDSRLITAFTAGQYVVWQLSGHVTVQFTRTAGSNALLCGIFFDR